MKQTPQLSGSEFVFLHAEPHLVREPQLMPQILPLQVGLPGLGSGQTLLHWPQWSTLLVVFTQALPHFVSEPQVKVQALL